MIYNSAKLANELKLAGITTHGNCNSNGVVWDDDNNEIQERPDVAAILAAHDPEPEPEGQTPELKIAELEEKIVILSKAADKTKLTPEEADVIAVKLEVN
jgi:hypothetical protein